MSDADGGQFVDTNVLIYAHDLSAGEKRARAQELLRDLWRSGTGGLSTQVQSPCCDAKTRARAPVRCQSHTPHDQPDAAGMGSCAHPAPGGSQ